MSPAGTEIVICERLEKFGYSKERHIRLYGEEFHLISNPFPEENGFAVEGIAHSSGQLNQVHIPLSLVQTLKRELALLDAKEVRPRLAPALQAASQRFIVLTKSFPCA